MCGELSTSTSPLIDLFLFLGSLGLTAGNVSPGELSASSPSPNSSQCVSNTMDPSSSIGKQNQVWQPFRLKFLWSFQTKLADFESEKNVLLHHFLMISNCAFLCLEIKNQESQLKNHFLVLSDRKKFFDWQFLTKIFFLISKHSKTRFDYFKKWRNNKRISDPETPLWLQCPQKALNKHFYFLFFSDSVNVVETLGSTLTAETSFSSSA